MDKKLLIYEKFFEEKMNTIEICEELDVSKQYVSKVLKTYYKDEYEKEKEKRKIENKKNRNGKKCTNIYKKRTELAVEAAMLRIQHESDVSFMSKGSKMSDKQAVFSCINAYDIDRSSGGTKLIFNESIGHRPNDLPATYSLIPKYVSINIYK